MKTLLIIIIIAGIGWIAQIKIYQIPLLESRIESFEDNERASQNQISVFESQKESLIKEVKSLNEIIEQLKGEVESKKENLPSVIIGKVEELEKKQEPKVDYSNHNSTILSNITRLTDEKRLEKEKLDVNVRQIEEYLAKGQTLLNEHLKVKPEFKDGNIKTSEADRQKWYEQHKIRETFLRTEISKLEGQKENLTRAYNSIAARIDLEIQKLEREIK